MDKFGFIIHPIDISQIRRFWPYLNLVPSKIIESFLRIQQPFKVSYIKNIRSIKDSETEGFFIACPLLPHQMLNLDTDFVINKIIRACRIAQDLGAKIVGLGGFTSVVGDKGITISKKLDIPVTTGNSLTVASVIESIKKAVESMNQDISNLKTTIIGATGSIGNACSRILINQVRTLTIVARHKEKLDNLAKQINSSKIEIQLDPHKSIKDADIVITTTSNPEALLDINEFKSGSIVCDVSVPQNITLGNNTREDVLFLKGGLMELPHKVDFGIDTELPNNLIYGCIAETMVLALEKKFESYSLGENLDLEKIDEILELAYTHGFEVPKNKTIY